MTACLMYAPGRMTFLAGKRLRRRPEACRRGAWSIFP
jgi:hypothetical protein